ncbi:hypothetical protein ACF1BQ_031805 [Bradyrhizobium sp. RDT10]
MVDIAGTGLNRSAVGSDGGGLKKKRHRVRGSLTILRCASRRPTRGLAEQVAGDVDYRITSPFFRVRFKICLHKNLDGLLTGMNFDAYRRVFELHFISATILSSDNRVRHFYATSGPAS